MSENKKFNQIWSNQTNMGKKFSLSAIAVGKLLVEAGLKDSTTKLATQKAIDEGYAKFTPLNDGTPYFMWNIEKICPLIAKNHEQLSDVNYWVNEVLEVYKEAKKLDDDNQDKLAYMMADCAYDNVPNSIIKEVRAKVEKITEKRD